MVKKHFKLIIILSIFLFAMLLVFFLFLFNANKNIKTLLGKIINIDTGTFTIITESDYIYTFNTPENFNFNVDENVEIKYSGELSFFDQIQNINILNLTKTTNFTFAHDGIFKDNYKKAESLISSMTTQEIVGQLLLVNLPITSHIIPIRNFHIGGYLFFENEVKSVTKDELIQNISLYQKVSKIPLLIAIDEEGGKISRLSKNPSIVPTPFLSSQELYNNGGFEAIKEDTIFKSNLLYELGFNVNLAPVADVTTNPDSYMYPRSFRKKCRIDFEICRNCYFKYRFQSIICIKAFSRLWR